MPKKDLPDLKITHKGVFLFGDVYKIMHDFLKQRDFVVHDFPEHGGSADCYEISLLMKGETKKNYIIIWKTKKELPGDYFRYIFDLKIEGKGLSKKEIVHDGKKVEVDDGELTVTISGKVETDYKKEWEKHWLLKHFVSVYDKKIMKSEMSGEHEASLFSTMTDLQNTLKRYFKILGASVTGAIYPERPE